MTDPSYFRTTEFGDYYCHSNSDFSSYQGWFIFYEQDWDLFKVIDNVYGDFDASLSHKSLYLKSKNDTTNVAIDLDFRWIHDYSDQGRIYEIYEKNNCIIVKYSKFFNNSLQELTFTKYLVIKGLESFNFKKEWREKFYSYDDERGALSKLFVFRLLEGQAKNLVFGFGSTEEDAMVSALVIPISSSKNFIVESKKINGVEKEALVAADLAFSSCVKHNRFNEPLIFAGYPWFYQVWARDECISLIGLFVQKRFDLAKRIIIRNLKSINEEGILRNRYPDSILGSADATGWFFQRISLFLKISNLEFSKKELDLIETKLDLFLLNCEEKSSTGLLLNGPKETWMDTTDINFIDTRSGARIEIQALHLSALELKKTLRKKSDDVDAVVLLTKKIKTQISLIRKRLSKDGILHDGFNGVIDETPRPNVFLAYYAYPALATKNQWIKTFDYALSHCWLHWGGLSSIGKNHELFKDTYSGMNNYSYHRGDSWFFINNIAALSLMKLDYEKYSLEINQIKKASVEELLNLGFIGYCAEVSSAKQLGSKGCLNQAWSSATLLELLLTSTKMFNNEEIKILNK